MNRLFSYGSKPLNIVVTGGSGFIGQQLFTAGRARNDICYEGGHNMLNIDLAPPREKDDDIPYLKADLADAEDTARVFHEAKAKLGGIDAVLNMVAAVSYTRPYSFLQKVNVQTAVNIASETQKRNALLVHMSGTAVHGNHLAEAIKETDPLNPVEPYGKSKAEAEQEIFKQVYGHNLRALIFRATAPVGPGLDSAGINGLYNMILEKPLVFATKGSKVTYVSTQDVARAFIFAAEHQDKVLRGRETLADIVYNLGVHDPFTDKQAGEHLVASILGEGKKKVIEISYWFVRAGSYGMHWQNSVANFFREHRKEPEMCPNLAKLIQGQHYQDPAKFSRHFEENRFWFKHDTPQKVLDTGVIYKFRTSWQDVEPPERIKELMQKG